MLLSGIAVFAIGRTFEHVDLAQVFSPSSLGALLYLSIFGSSIAFFLMMWLLQRIPVGIVGMASLVFPAIALTVGAFFGGEHFTLRELIGSAFVVLGMYLALSSPGAPANVEETTLPEVA
jgi:drug/metabolite transporter (DMT)-like permease